MGDGALSQSEIDALLKVQIAFWMLILLHLHREH